MSIEKEIIKKAMREEHFSNEYEESPLCPICDTPMGENWAMEYDYEFSEEYEFEVYACLNCGHQEPI